MNRRSLLLRLPVLAALPWVAKRAVGEVEPGPWRFVEAETVELRPWFPVKHRLTRERDLRPGVVERMTETHELQPSGEWSYASERQEVVTP